MGIWSAAEAAERRPDARYRAFDLGEELAREAELASRLWGALLPHLESGALRALPCTVYPGQEAVAALRTMQQASHVGKLVVDLTLPKPPVLRPEASYLITGGLGGLGLAAVAAGLGVNAGHDLSQGNLEEFLENVPDVLEVSIGHALIGELELPSTGVERTYRARCFGDVSQEQLEELIHGIEIEGVKYGKIDANLERRTGRNGWVEMTLTEGKNREVRRVLEHLGLEVSRLIRTRYGPFVLGELAPGTVGEVRRVDLIEFRKTLK